MGVKALDSTQFLQLGDQTIDIVDLAAALSGGGL